jgi:hypothetical protein
MSGTARLLGFTAVVAAVALAGWVWSSLRDPRGGPRPVVTAEPPPPASQTSHITATVYFGATSGAGLVARRVEVPLAATAAAQGEAILRAALTDPPPGALRVVPRGTRLRSFFLDAHGEAFIDVTSEVRRLHPGGSFSEALTVAAVVGAVTTNLSAVRRVRLLVDGHQVETLAGHLDISRPLLPDLSLVVSPR